MNLDFKSTQLTKVKDIEIPDIFSRRLKTGITKVDSLFDEGILPGSAATLTAQAGCGKTTFMLQLLNGLTKNGYKVGYFSGEESIYQLAYTATRVKSTDVPVANITDIDTIKSMMFDLDLIVIDSFQALTAEAKMNSRQLEKYAVQTLTRHAKAVECTVVFIMHLTKSGDLKGGTIVPHTVDANIKIDKVTDVEDEETRAIYFEKNRFGPLNELECTIGRHGYDFDATVVREDSKARGKGSKKNADYEIILDEVNRNSYGVTMEHVVKLMDGNVARAYSRLRDLVLTGKLEKVGRGTDAVWRLDESTDDNSVVRFAAQTK
jgi:RecA/RadA recombinase